MSASPNSNPAPAKDSGLGAIALMVIAVAAIVLWWMRPVDLPADEFIGVSRPPLNAGGWFNSDRPPSEESLAGKVVLIDFWFVGCPPCRAGMPNLVEFYKRFQKQGLVLIGLTPDSGEEAQAAEEFVKSTEGFTWPVGYDAQMPIDMLGVSAFPTMILFDKTGKAVWAGHNLAGLDEAVIAALAGK